MVEIRTAVLEGPQNFKIVDVPRPEPGAGEVLIKVASCGVCNSEMGMWEGSFGEYPKRIGHEVSGTIAELGENVDDLQVGDRVVLFTDRHGYSEYLTIPAKNVIPIGEDVPFDAAMGEPIGCVVNGLRRSGIKIGDTVVLVGVGFMGLIMLQLIQNMGAARVIAVDTNSEALERAAALGADMCLNPIEQDVPQIIQDKTNGVGADVVVELTGNQQGLDLATELPRVRGKLVIFGFHTSERSVNMFLWNWRGYDVVNAHERDPEEYITGIRIGMRMLAAGKLNMEPLITHTFSLDEINEAFAKTHSKGAGFIKAVVNP